MMITYTTFQGITVRNNFDTLGQALAFVRLQELGTSFVIKKEDETIVEYGDVSIKVQVTYADKTKGSFNFESLTEALKIKRVLNIGDTFLIKEGEVKLAKGKMEPYKGGFYV